MTDRDDLLAGLDTLGLPATLADALLAYRDLLLRWNQAYNLTSVRDPAAMVPRHLLDSLSIRPFVQGQRLIDVGTGAGLPGLPLAIADPQRSVTLLDGNSKKTRFCQHAVFELGLTDIAVVHERAENYHPEQAFDTVTGRAFASLAEFVRVAGHLCAEGGRMLAMKGTLPEGEAEAVDAGWSVHCTPLEVPYLDEERCVVILERNSDPT
jgi:16S rRNA (guanine527-N7)-methyltransferase